MINKNVTRWIWASVSKYFDDNKGSLVFFFEGDDRATDEIPAFCEFRMDGPRIKEISKNFYDLNVFVNVLVQRHMDQVGTHDFWQMLGGVQNLFPKCLNVFKYGDGPEDNPSVMIGTLELQYSSPLDQVKTANFGQVDQTVRLQQATIEGRYRMQLTQNIETVFYLDFENQLALVDAVEFDTAILATSDLNISDDADLLMVFDRQLSDALSLIDAADVQVGKFVEDTLELVDEAEGNIVSNQEVEDTLEFVDEAEAVVEASVFRVFFGFQNPSNSHYEIRSVMSDGSAETTILDTGTSVLQALAYDYTNDFIYYGRNNGTVRKVKPDGSGDAAVASGFGVIIAMTVDPVNNRMWVYDRTTNFIQQMALDGSGLTNLTAESYAQVCAIAYDAAATSLFWCNTTQVRRYNFTGPSVSTLFNPGSTDIFSTATDGGGSHVWFTRSLFIVRNTYAGSSETTWDVSEAFGPFYLFHHPLGDFMLYTVAVDGTTAGIRMIANGGPAPGTEIITKTGLDNGLISALAAG